MLELKANWRAFRRNLLCDKFQKIGNDIKIGNQK